MKNESNMEYERQFLLKDNKQLESIKSRAVNSMEIIQTYLSFSPSLRIRKIIHDSNK